MDDATNLAFLLPPSRNRDQPRPSNLPRHRTIEEVERRTHQRSSTSLSTSQNSRNETTPNLEERDRPARASQRSRANGSLPKRRTQGELGDILGEKIQTLTTIEKKSLRETGGNEIVSAEKD